MKRPLERQSVLRSRSVPFAVDIHINVLNGLRWDNNVHHPWTLLLNSVHAVKPCGHAGGLFGALGASAKFRTDAA